MKLLFGIKLNVTSVVVFVSKTAPVVKKSALGRIIVVRFLFGSVLTCLDGPIQVLDANHVAVVIAWVPMDRLDADSADRAIAIATQVSLCVVLASSRLLTKVVIAVVQVRGTDQHIRG